MGNLENMKDRGVTLMNGSSSFISTASLVSDTFGHGVFPWERICIYGGTHYLNSRNIFGI